MAVKGRPAHQPTEQTRNLVRRLSGLGVVVDDIARIAEIHDDTVRKYYHNEIERGRAEANMAVSRALFHAATRPNNPNVVAGIFWLKNRAGWKDAVVPGAGNGSTLLRVEFINGEQSQPKQIANKGNGHGTVIDVPFEEQS